MPWQSAGIESMDAPIFKNLEELEDIQASRSDIRAV
jgi:hypothetical protein